MCIRETLLDAKKVYFFIATRQGRVLRFLLLVEATLYYNKKVVTVGETMGYDDDECMFCYCVYGCNTIPEDDTHYDVCLKCLSYVTQGDSTSGRVIGALQNNRWTCNSHCGYCDKKSMITIEIALCKHHLGDFPSSSSESEESES